MAIAFSSSKTTAYYKSFYKSFVAPFKSLDKKKIIYRLQSCETFSMRTLFLENKDTQLPCIELPKIPHLYMIVSKE